MKKRIILKQINIFFIVFIFCLLFSSCVIQKKSLMRTIFKMKIGYGENEIGLISDNKMSKNIINIVYKNGFYYIADNVNNKILKTTEKGNLLMIIYNKDFNPTLKPTRHYDMENNGNTEEENKIIYTKLYSEYPVYSPSFIAADLNKNIYFVNSHPSYKKMDEFGAIYGQLILKFNNNGEFQYSIGKNGQFTSPFGDVVSMNTDENDNLLVMENEENSIVVYKFSSDGNLLKKSIINRSNIPLNAREIDYTAYMVDAKLGYSENTIYVTAQMIKETNENGNINYESAYERILEYSIEDEKYGKALFRINLQFIDVAKVISDRPDLKNILGDKQKIPKPFDNFLGVDTNNYIYFSQKDTINDLVDNIYSESLIIYDHNGRMANNFSVRYSSGGSYVSPMFFSESGIIYSYYIKNGEISFVVIN